jgi:hypothetical protein
MQVPDASSGSGGLGGALLSVAEVGDGFGERGESGDEPRQRRKPEPVGMIPPQPAAELTAQHLVLVAQDQQLDILGQAGRASTVKRPNRHLSRR